MRIRLDLAYDGSDFSGWARQPGLRTVEQTLGEGLATILRRDQPRLTVGGRTDAGVHARGSVCHLDLGADDWAALPGRSSRSPAEALVTRLRGVLPDDLVVHRAAEVDEAFDARFSALRRRYSYRLADHPQALDPLRRRDTVAVRRPLDETAMDLASRPLVGLGDFAAFCRPREGASTIRTLLEFSWSRDPAGVVVGRIVADAFCHHMVRALVGSVVAVGDGGRGPDWPRAVLDAAVRDPAVQVMPAHGLCLEEIVYPEAVAEQRARAEESRAVRAPGEGGAARLG